MGLSVAAPLSSEPPLCCLEWPLEVRLGTCWRVAVPQAVLSLCWRPPSPCSAPRLWTHKCFPAVGPLLGLGHTWNATLPSAGSIFCLC